MADKKHNKLEYLSDLKKYEMADDSPDVRGWDVYDAHDEKVGKVTGLLASPEREKIVYLDVEPLAELLPENHNPFDAEHEKGVHEYQDRKGNVRMIIPVGEAHVDRDKKVVVADGISTTNLKDYPTYRYRKDLPIHADYERRVRNRNRQVTLPKDDKRKAGKEPEGNYDTADYDTDRFYGRKDKRT